MHTRLLVATVALTSGCGANTMAQEWQLDRLRILAVKGTPAEPRPGELVTFDSLVYVPPNQTLDGVLWFGCIPEGDIGFGCPFDEDALSSLSELDPSTTDPAEFAAALEELQEAGFIGFEPYLAPTWQAPLDALDGLTEAQRQEGVNAVINLTATPALEDGSEPETDDLEIAYKRIPVSEAQTPNHNPDIDTVAVQGQGWIQGTGTLNDPLVLAAGKVVTLTPILAEDAVESYIYTTSTGELEEREEEPYCSWYTEGGQFDQNISLQPHLDVEFTAPEQSGWTGLLAVVLLDRRGGMAWQTLHLAVE